MKIIIERNPGVMNLACFDWMAYEDGGDELVNGLGASPQAALDQFLFVKECADERMENERSNARDMEYERMASRYDHDKGGD